MSEAQKLPRFPYESWPAAQIAVDARFTPSSQAMLLGDGLWSAGSINGVLIVRRDRADAEAIIRLHRETPDQQRTEGVSALSGKNEKSSAGRFAGWSTIWGKDGDHKTPYMTRIWIGRLRLHIFHRPDQDPDCHDHPWDFWTFPLTSYVEERAVHFDDGDPASAYTTFRQIVRAWRLTYRPAEHTHRVLGRLAVDGTGWLDPRTNTFPEWVPDDVIMEPGKIVTLVWRGPARRKWGFLKLRDGRWCWSPWKEYVFGTGKSAACQ